MLESRVLVEAGGEKRVPSAGLITRAQHEGISPRQRTPVPFLRWSRRTNKSNTLKFHVFSMLYRFFTKSHQKWHFINSNQHGSNIFKSPVIIIYL